VQGVERFPEWIEKGFSGLIELPLSAVVLKVPSNFLRSEYNLESSLMPVQTIASIITMEGDINGQNM